MASGSVKISFQFVLNLYDGDGVPVFVVSTVRPEWQE